MGTISSIKNRVLAIRGREVEIAVQALQESDELILALNRKQLFDGKDSTGADLTPSYFNDPYFKTPEAAARYSAWKDEITPSPKRTKGTPNLYINGYFHNSIEVSIDVSGLHFRATAEMSNDIKRKYGGVIYGLNADRRSELNRTTIPSFISRMRKEIKL